MPLCASLYEVSAAVVVQYSHTGYGSILGTDYESCRSEELAAVSDAVCQSLFENYGSDNTL